MWAAIQALDEAAKHELLGHLRTHLDIPDARRTMQQAQVAKAVASLREAVEILAARGGGEELTTRAYERLRAELDRGGDWPPQSSIRRFVGGTWNDALRRAQLDPVADGDALRAQLGGRLTAEECAAAVRECSQETRDPLPTYSSYIAWCRRPDVRRRPGRRPHSQAPLPVLCPVGECAGRGGAGAAGGGDRAGTGGARRLVAITGGVPVGG